MAFRLADANVVVVAHHFNPSIVNQLWLVKNGLVREEDFVADCVFTNMFAQIATRELTMLVTPDQLQFTPRAPQEKVSAGLLEKIGKFAELLPHTPYVAIGLNFNYHFMPERRDVKALTRELFFVPRNRLYELFDTKDAKFGGYLSQDMLGFRLKLDTKPALTPVVGEGGVQEFVLAAFNFHQDLIAEADPVRKIKESLAKWKEAEATSLQIIEVIAERDCS